MSSIDTQYDSLLNDVFIALGNYQTLMDAFQEQQYDAFEMMNDAERQNGVFSVQLNSSSYFSVALSASIGVDTNTKDDISMRSRTVEESLKKSDKKQNTQKSNTKDVNQSDSEDEDEVPDSRVYTKPQLLKLFALVPSKELSSAQDNWTTLINTQLVELVKAKKLLTLAIQAVEEFKVANKSQ
jgi:hypothetical protein